MIYSGDFATINSVESHGIEAPHELANHEPQVLILDDFLVNTDPVRQDRMLDVLGTQAARLEILILNCHPDRYRGIGQPIAFSTAPGSTAGKRAHPRTLVDGCVTFVADWKRLIPASLACGIEWPPATRGAQALKIPLAFAGARKQVSPNTRAVPLVRKDDAHQGRVFFLPRFEANRREAAA